MRQWCVTGHVRCIPRQLVVADRCAFLVLGVPPVIHRTHLMCYTQLSYIFATSVSALSVVASSAPPNMSVRCSRLYLRYKLLYKLYPMHMSGVHHGVRCTQFFISIFITGYAPIRCATEHIWCTLCCLNFSCLRVSWFELLLSCALNS